MLTIAVSTGKMAIRCAGKAAAVWLHLCKGGECPMPLTMTVTFHVGKYTVTVQVKVK